jgi:hypothetical protein
MRSMAGGPDDFADSFFSGKFIREHKPRGQNDSQPCGGCPTLGFVRVGLGFSFLGFCVLFLSVTKPHRWHSIPVHLSCSPTNCSTASPSDASLVSESPGSRQFLHKESSRTLGPQQIQPPIATESHKMQISPPVIPFQSIRHRALLTPPQDPPSQTEGGAPSAYLYFSCRFGNGILPCGRLCQEKIKCPGPPVRRIWDSLLALSVARQNLRHVSSLVRHFKNAHKND